MSDEEKEKAAPSPVEAEDGGSGEIDLSAFGGALVHGDRNYESRFMKDAMQRAHDRELAALANLALIRSNTDERNMLLMTLEREQAMSPREVNRRLRTAETEGKNEGSEKNSSK